MTARTRKILFHVGSFALAGVLLYLSLRGVNLDSVLTAFREADYRWLLPLIIAALTSHLLRAWRWQLLLDALPPSTSDSNGSEAPQRATLWQAFTSIMIGYMVNYAAPRLGEVARTANLSTRTKMNFSGVFGTVVVERVLDMAVLALALLTLVPIYSDQLAVLQTRFIGPALAQVEELSGPMLLLVAGSGVLLLGLLVGGLWWAIQRQGSAIRQLWKSTLQPAFVSFRDGMMTVLRAKRRGALIGSTLAMWGGYAIMAYFPLIMLGLATPYDLGLIDAWGLMLIGALGLVVPSPGGLGSYHYVTIQALVYLYAVPEADAATYAVLTHAAQLVLYTALGGILLAAQGISLRSLQKKAPADAESEATVPAPSSAEESSG